MKRSTAVVALLVCAGVMWVLGSQNWGAEVVNQTPTGVQDVGSETVTNRVGIALAAVSAVLAVLLAMVGRIGRWVVTVMYALSALIFAVVAVTQEGAGFVRWAGLAVGVLGAGLSLFIARGSGNWTTRNKYDRDAHTSTDEPDSVSDWDALTRGEDPT